MLHDQVRGFDYPENFFNIDGLDCHYVDHGSGQPVVMLHGNPSWSYYYRGLISSLGEGFRSIAIDQIGCGKSQKPGPSDYPFSMQRRIEDLERLVDHLGLSSPIDLVLHDWGGIIGMAFAGRRPEFIRKIVLTNTCAFRLPKTKNVPWAIALARKPVLGRALVQGLNAFALGASYVGTKRHPMGSQTRAGYLAPYDSWGNREAVYRFIKDIPLSPKDESWPTLLEAERNLSNLVDHEILFVWGDQDPVFDGHFLEEWRRFLPNARFEVLEGAGHYVLEDEPQRSSSLIKSFLSESRVDD